MLAEEPLAPDLLAIARELLLKELLPALPPDKAFAARMVANAMAIAGRSASEGEAESRLAALAGDTRAFAAAIREGRFDPGTPRHGEAATLLDDITRLRCLVSAPRALG